MRKFAFVPSALKNNLSTTSKLLKAASTKSQKQFYAKAQSPLTVGEEAILQPSYKFPEFLTRAPPTQVTKLSNGLRVVTEKRQGETAAIAVYVTTGSRQESFSNNGVAHFLEHMYFKGTPNRNARDLEYEFENKGASMNAHTSREYTTFSAHCLKDDVPGCLDALADVILNSKLDPRLIDAERSTILREMEDVNQKMDEVIFDQLHLSAFQGTSLGFTILGPKENIETINRQQMVNFRNAFYKAGNMILVGVGDIDHEKLVQLGAKYFGEVPAGKGGHFTPEAPFIGSEVKIANPEINQLHFAVAFEGPSIASKDIITLQILQLMLGSYEKSMGAGKYVTTPLCQDISDYDLARSITPFNHAYGDKGLFGLHAISDGGETTENLMVQTVAHMTRFCYKVNPQEVERAKNLYKTQLLSSYEGTLPTILDEVGRQMVYYGRRVSVAEMFARVDNITAEDVKRVAAKYIFDKDPVVVTIGKVDEVVDWSWLRIHTYQWRL